MLCGGVQSSNEGSDVSAKNQLLLGEKLVKDNNFAAKASKMWKKLTDPNFWDIWRRNGDNMAKIFNVWIR